MFFQIRLDFFVQSSYTHVFLTISNEFRPNRFFFKYQNFVIPRENKKDFENKTRQQNLGEHSHSEETTPIVSFGAKTKLKRFD